MRQLSPRLWALVLLSGCAGAPPVRNDLDPLREEIRALRLQNEALSAKVEALSEQVDLLTLRATRAGPAAQVQGAAPEAQAAAAAPADAGAVPPDLAVVKMTPPTAKAAAAAPRSGARTARAAPPVPTSVPIQEPDAARLDALGRPGRKPLAAEADQELREARALSGLPRAHALEDFTGRYPQHPSADNALVEAAAAYAAAGHDDAGCSLARRALDEYPAGDAQSDALEVLVGCETRRGNADGAQKLLDRLRADFPGTPAAQRAEARLSQAPGRETSTRDLPARSGP